MKFYFNLRSPYSWLTVHDLLARHPGLARRLEWIPFWDPEEATLRELDAAGGRFGYTAMSKAKHLYILQDVRRLARARGLEPRWPLDRGPRWEVPHLAYLIAADHGAGQEFAVRAGELRWQQGADICDPQVVAELGRSLGLDEAGLIAAADDPKLRERGIDALRSADRDGVFGVPFLVHGREKFWGLDRLDSFAESAGEPVAGGYPPEDHPGGCG
ncbi:2-hydroxychromene-2-carboxylate isomerase [Nonomuraea sp. SBT364]|uniref:2-hydroxychromene-2-carboxylate isomerase n=1 Tax=Nonomuraea sp. SBT364 TaxID=1580530 RepID=UPI00066DA67C|nr:DsbA family protein [Nonomuraea sp. SBT364]